MSRTRLFGIKYNQEGDAEFVEAPLATLLCPVWGALYHELRILRMREELGFIMIIVGRSKELSLVILCTTPQASNVHLRIDVL